MIGDSFVDEMEKIAFSKILAGVGGAARGALNAVGDIAKKKPKLAPNKRHQAIDKIDYSLKKPTTGGINNKMPIQAKVDLTKTTPAPRTLKRQAPKIEGEESNLDYIKRRSQEGYRKSNQRADRFMNTEGLGSEQGKNFKLLAQGVGGDIALGAGIVGTGALTGGVALKSMFSGNQRDSRDVGNYRR